MLQQIREGVGRWVAGIILALIAVAFIFWGVDPTIMGTTFAAKVNGENISLVDFERTLQIQQSQYQDLYRVEIAGELQRELRLSVLEGLIRDEALSQRVASEGYHVSDGRLALAIRSRPEFQVGGEFSMDVYRSQLLFSGLSPTAFEEQQREQLELIELQNGVALSAFYTPAEFARYIELYEQEREIAYALFPAEGFLAEVELDEAQILAHYADNKDRFFSEESVDLEYIEFLRTDFTEGIEVTDEILESFYEEESYRFQTAEDRRARHILIGSPEADPDAEARATDVLARLDAGEDFADLANELSDDPGTRAEGGELGWMSQGEGAFQDAVFSMETGEVRGPVRTEFGYHIIRLDEIRAGEVRSFDSVKEELADDYRNRRAEELFFDAAEELDARAFDAFDELANVAADMNLPLKTFAGFTRTGSASPFPVSEPVVQAAFSTEVLELGENSRLVEILDDHVAVLRVSAHHSPQAQSLEAVRTEIEEELTRTAAEALADAAAAEFFVQASVLPAAADGDAGSEAVEVLDGEPDAETEDAPSLLAARFGGQWTARRWVARADSTVPAEIITSVFLARPDDDGAVVRERVALANGDEAVSLLFGVRPGNADRLTREELQARIGRLAGDSAGYELSSYVQHVREQATVRIPDEVLDPPLY